MKRLYTLATVLLTVWGADAQLQQNEVRPESGQTEYIVNAASGPVTLVATESIRLLPGAHIQNGSDLRAYINDSPYEGPVLPGGTSGENYIYTRTYQKGMTDDTGIDSNRDVIEGITYFDGLGRPMQQIAIKASPGLRDIVTHMEYDVYGRMEREYLPYEETDLLEDLGSLRTDAKADTETYYTDNYADDLDVNAPNPYSEKLFEPSPLNRVLEQAAPGEDWKLGNDHEIRFEYLTNSANEVRRYGVDLTPDYVPTLDIDTNNEFYTENELRKTVTKDENWTSGKNHTTEEYTDKRGQVVLKRTYADVTLPGGAVSVAEPHDTYYVYDDHGNLGYVIPPKVDSGDGVSAAELDGLCYQYRYDHRNRLIEKKIPGKGSATDWESIVYNTLDRPIMTQDPNLKAQGKWLYTKYDAFGRVAYTGMLNSTASRATHQTNADSYADNPTHTQWVVPGSTTINSTSIGYTNDGYPNTGYGELHTINYYDGYNTARDGFAPPNGPIMGQPVSNAVQGLSTVSKVRVLGENDWITTLTAYDGKGRAIYTRTENPFLGTSDIAESQLDHAGKVLDTKTVHTKGTKDPITVEDRFEYDHAARLTGQYQRINGQGEQLFTNTYDGIGQLVKKDVGNTEANPLQEVDYDYNIRGWLKNIGDNGNLFTSAIHYNRPPDFEDRDDFVPLYNGNIAEIRWSTSTSEHDGYFNYGRGYTYHYDALNRLKAANSYSIFRRNTAYPAGSGQYTVDNIDYDKNGNLTHLDRMGGGAEWDELSYGYFDDGNKLKSVTDTAIGTQKDEGFKDGWSGTTDYDYDANGNMTQDLNKGIQTGGIAYNHLNLPEQVTVSGTNAGVISYIYDATGMKLRKNVLKNGVTIPTDYAGNYIYENNSLQFLSTPEGYVEPKNAANLSQGHNYVYQYKDHLGNVRLSYTNNNGTVEIVEENNYYPFGLKHKGYNNVVNSTNPALKYKFGGKELNDELGLDWYDFGARNYDASLGRWMNLDPLADRYTRISPYTYVANTPLMAIDPDGEKIIFVNGYNNKYVGGLFGAADRYKDYWGQGFGQAAQRFFNDYSSLENYNYVDGSSSYAGDSSGSDREQAGFEYAAANYNLLTKGLEDGETFKLVTHSEGGAYGAGIARYLMLKGYEVETIVHLSTDEADEFDTPFGPKTYQLGLKGDWVTGNKELGNADIFAVLDAEFESGWDEFTGAHGSTKSAGVFDALESLINAVANKKGVATQITETKDGYKFEFVRD